MIHQYIELNAEFAYCTCGEWSQQDVVEETMVGFQTHMQQLASEAERLRLDPRGMAIRARRPIR